MTVATKNSRADVEQLKFAAAGRWGEILTAVTDIDVDLLDGQHHPCPRCGGQDRFRAFDDFAETGGLLCNQCFTEKNGDGISAIQWRLGLDFSAAVTHISDFLGTVPSGNDKPKTNGKPQPKSFDEQVKWNDSTTETSELCRTRTFEEFAQAKTGVTVDAIRAARGRLCLWPRKANEPFECIAFPAQRTPTGEIIGWILYRADGQDFPAIPNGPGQRKTHMLRGSKDGWVLPGGWDALKEAAVALKVDPEHSNQRTNRRIRLFMRHARVYRTRTGRQYSLNAAGLQPRDRELVRLRTVPELTSRIQTPPTPESSPERWASARRFFVARRSTGGLTPTAQGSLFVSPLQIIRNLFSGWPQGLTRKRLSDASAASRTHSAVGAPSPLTGTFKRRASRAERQEPRARNDESCLFFLHFIGSELSALGSGLLISAEY